MSRVTQGGGLMDSGDPALRAAFTTAFSTTTVTVTSTACKCATEVEQHIAASTSSGTVPRTGCGDLER